MSYLSYCIYVFSYLLFWYFFFFLVILFFDFFFFSSRRRHTRCALVTGVQTCALPISQIIDSQVDGAEPREPHGALFGRQVLVLLEGADHRHGATGNVEHSGDHAAMQNAVKEVADLLMLHPQVHDNSLSGHFVPLDPPVFLVWNALAVLAPFFFFFFYCF